MNYFIDIHTHSGLRDEDVIRILNVPFNGSLERCKKPISIGIHPWEINDDADLDKSVFIAHSQEFACIGEIGLDKMRKSYWDKQLELFESQLLIAMELRKPVIIHCVKAYNEVAQILAKLNFNQVVIFHSFQSSTQMALSLVQKGYYLSFGRSLYESREKSIESLKTIPIDNVFFETDDNAYPIRDLYKIAANNLNLPLDDLKQICWNNYERIFY